VNVEPELQLAADDENVSVNGLMAPNDDAQTPSPPNEASTIDRTDTMVSAPLARFTGRMTTS
jgi:hypothetical protein